MDANVKKSVLRMIPYGMYVLTAKGKDDAVAAATVNWVTQASFAPPLVAVGVKTDSHAHAAIKHSNARERNGRRKASPRSTDADRKRVRAIFSIERLWSRPITSPGKCCVRKPVPQATSIKDRMPSERRTERNCSTSSCQPGRSRSA